MTDTVLHKYNIYACMIFACYMFIEEMHGHI